MGGEVLVVVSARVQMELVKDVTAGQDLVEGRGAGFEAVVVLVATVEIDLQTRESSSAGERERAILLPESGVEGTAENSAEDAIAGSKRSGGGDGRRDFVDERGAVCARGRKKLRVAKRQVERAVTAHGDSVDGAIGAAGCGSITLFDKGEKFLDHEIFVTILAVSAVDIEASSRVRSGDQKIFQLEFIPHIFYDIP